MKRKNFALQNFKAFAVSSPLQRQKWTFSSHWARQLSFLVAFFFLSKKKEQFGVGTGNAKFHRERFRSRTAQYTSVSIQTTGRKNCNYITNCTANIRILKLDKLKGPRMQSRTTLWSCFSPHYGNFKTNSFGKCEARAILTQTNDSNLLIMRKSGLLLYGISETKWPQQKRRTQRPSSRWFCLPFRSIKRE